MTTDELVQLGKEAVKEAMKVADIREVPLGPATRSADSVTK